MSNKLLTRKELESLRRQWTAPGLYRTTGTHLALQLTRTALAVMDERDNWINDAKMYAAKADYWREEAEAVRADEERLERLRRLVIKHDRVVIERAEPSGPDGETWVDWSLYDRVRTGRTPRCRGQR